MDHIKYSLLIAATFSLVLLSCNTSENEDQIREEIIQHGEIIRRAFSGEDIETITRLHHPKVIKALGYNRKLIGRGAVVSDLSNTMDIFTLEFVKNETENILIEDNIAIEQTLFSIRGTPKNGDKPFTFEGRTMVTYLRYEDSPTGWATIREIIQPATE